MLSVQIVVWLFYLHFSFFELPIQVFELREEGLVVIFLIFFLFFSICHVYPPFTRKRNGSLYFGRDVHTRLGVAISAVSGPPVFHIKAGRPVKCLAQGHSK